VLESNLEEVKKRLARAAAKRNASPGEINLVAVTKDVSREAIMEAWKLGLRDFGENRVQEAIPKIKSLPPDIRWHFIGHLQSNKVKYVLPSFQLIHSLDRGKLARALQKEGEKQDKVVHCLLQVNVGMERSKSGFHPDEVEDALIEAARYKSLKVLGLMAIAPFLPEPEELRPYFRRLFQIYKNITVPGVQMKYLSMGMSSDFEVAVEEGANVVRLGSALFGERSEK